MDRDVQLCGRVSCDDDALSMKWHWLIVGCSDRDRKFKKVFFIISVVFNF
jgi:hypothetical protein